MGKAEAVEYKGFPETSRRFYQEVTEIRRGYESENTH
jgi:hypothetical protein